MALCTIGPLKFRKFNNGGQSKEGKKQVFIERAELISINGVIEESADHISEVINRVNKLYTNVVNDFTICYWFSCFSLVFTHFPLILMDFHKCS